LPAPPRVAVPDEARRQAGKVLSDLGMKAGQRYIALAPGAQWPAKEWPPAFYAELAGRLDRELKYIPLLVGGAAEAERCAVVACQAGGRAISAAGLTDLPVLAALLEAADLLICNDSGPMHLGAAAGTRVVAFFGPTVPEFGFMPQTPVERSRILSVPLRCRPCSLHGGKRCPVGHHHCLRTLRPDEAFAAVRELLNEK